MSNASISDVIPDWFGDVFWNCDDIDLSNNHIRGELLTKFRFEGYKKALTWYLHLSENYLTSEIPKWLCSLTDLRLLDLSTNKFSGEIPPCLGELKNLKVVNLANNHLYAHIPNLFGSLYYLRSLSLRNNGLRGKLPSSLQNLRSLVLLDLSENELGDVIPSWMGEKLTSMRFLVLDANNFYGDIPLQLCQLPNL
ncbi:receptor-like protein EIX2 [Ipomoea triloba]|uniref:receptor-like protein EIX2 n=1 Tax=Ipomoea triloba TaxID=35885 RepID=UPI00125D272E|nr:receptor-like protein EIX2 [Ipomoea triloba]